MGHLKNYVSIEFKVKEIISGYYKGLISEFETRLETHEPSDFTGFENEEKVQSAIMNYHTDRGHAMHNSYRDHPDEPGWRVLKEKYGLDINTMKPDEFSRAFEKFIITQLHKANDDPETIDGFFGEGEEKEILNLFLR